jgi:hypothetical protein
MDKLCRQDEVNACIDEIEWYATRAKNLAAEIDKPTTDIRTWGEMMLSDLADLRACLILERTFDPGTARGN